LPNIKAMLMTHQASKSPSNKNEKLDGERTLRNMIIRREAKLSNPLTNAKNSFIERKVNNLFSKKGNLCLNTSPLGATAIGLQMARTQRNNRYNASHTLDLLTSESRPIENKRLSERIS